MLAARVEPKNEPQESKKTGNLKLLSLSQFQTAVDTRWNNLLGGLTVRRTGGPSGQVPGVGARLRIMTPPWFLRIYPQAY
jgi:hypothetical protein